MGGRMQGIIKIIEKYLILEPKNLTFVFYFIYLVIRQFLENETKWVELTILVISRKS
jgi:hypothetical protein